MRTTSRHKPTRIYRSTVTRKGQLTVPAAQRRHLGWQQGDVLHILVGDIVFAVRLARKGTAHRRGL